MNNNNGTTRWINESTAPGILRLDSKLYAADPARLAPFDAEAERATLGGILIAGEVGSGSRAYREVSFLNPKDYFLIAHSYVFRACQRLAERGAEIDAITVASELAAQPMAGKPGASLLDEIGGRPFLHKLMNATGGNLGEYARLVARAALRRSLMASCDEGKALALNEKLSIETVAERAQRALNDVLLRIYALTAANTHNLHSAVGDYAARLQADMAANAQVGVTTGYYWLDQYLLGWLGGKFYLVAGRPGMGKTAFMLCSALAALRAGKRVLFFSLEMQLDELIERVISIEARIDSRLLRSRRLNAEQVGQMNEAVRILRERVASKAFTIEIADYPTVGQLRSKLDELRFTPGYDVVFIDYGGWEMVSDGGQFRGNTVPHAGYVAKSFKSIAKDYGVPVVAGWQASRECENRRDKRPQLSDLSDSSLVEKQADAVMMLFWQARYDELPDEPNLVEAIVRKNRSGPGNKHTTVKLYFTPEFTRFDNWQKEIEDHVKA
jgi:replicative DNA helicase